MPLFYVRNDITKMEVDAVVNAANTSLRQGSGVCGAIFAAAGAEKLQSACDALAPIKTGEAVLTSGYGLPAKHIIHTAGPLWRGGQAGEEELLRQAYTNSLSLALEHEMESIAFPLISAGSFGFPQEKALRIANKVIREFLEVHEMMVYQVIYDRQSLLTGLELALDIKAFVDDKYVDEHLLRRESRMPYEEFAKEDEADYFELAEMSVMPIQKAAAPSKRSLEELVNNLEESFSEMLLRLIDEKGYTDVETYKRANLSRKLFSKIRGNKDYRPSKPTVMALAIALRLSLDETKDLLRKAGFAFSHSSKFDVIIEYFIVKGIYNIFEINEALFDFNQILLGK